MQDPSGRKELMDVVLQYSRRQKHLMQRRTQPQKKYGWLPKLLLFKLLLFMDCTLCPWAFREVVCVFRVVIGLVSLWRCCWRGRAGEMNLTRRSLKIQWR